MPCCSELSKTTNRWDLFLLTIEEKRHCTIAFDFGTLILLHG